MEKTLKLALNKYNPTPPSLRSVPSGAPMDMIRVNLANLFHHYYLDCHDRAPPDPDPTRFEATNFLLPCEEFRFQGSGFGSSTASRRNRSNELGQAFCRQFLYEHLGFTYFAHVAPLLGKTLGGSHAGCRLERVEEGDTPDYLCADASSEPFLAEAKGRYTSVSFKSKEFQTWRDQFTRVVLKDPSGEPRRVKGHIVATRFATEEDSARLRTTLFAEDPNTRGNFPLGPDLGVAVVRAVRSRHYSRIATKLRQPLLASSLATGTPLTNELRVLAVVWQVLQGPLAKRQFVGGYFGVDDARAEWRKLEGDGEVFVPRDPLRLDAPGFTFFGLEEEIFRQVVSQARGGQTQDAGVRQFEESEFFDSAFSVLRDGSVLAPLDYFRPLRTIAL